MILANPISRYQKGEPLRHHTRVLHFNVLSIILYLLHDYLAEFTGKY